jgi:hypothetical protein
MQDLESFLHSQLPLLLWNSLFARDYIVAGTLNASCCGYCQGCYVAPVPLIGLPLAAFLRMRPNVWDIKSGQYICYVVSTQTRISLTREVAASALSQDMLC